MQILICTSEGLKKVKAYKTKYKNVVIVYIDDVKLYSITHYQTGLGISRKKYKTKKKAFDDLERVIEKDREELNKIIRSIKGRTKRINF